MTERDDNDLYSEIWIFAGNNGLLDQDREKASDDPGIETVPWYNKVPPSQPEKPEGLRHDPDMCDKYKCVDCERTRIKDKEALETRIKAKKYFDELREKEWREDMKRYEYWKKRERYEREREKYGKEMERQAQYLGGCPVAPDDRGFAPADDL